jgi:hypothetical protein
VDDIVIKTQKSEDFISELAETFKSLRKFSMKLNPEKCTFGVPLGKLLGYMVSHRGIDPNLEKISAIMNMKLAKSLHDMQNLIEGIATLSRFISRLSIRGLPFFKIVVDLVLP